MIRRFALLAALALLGTSRARAAPGDATRLEYGRSADAAACPDREALKGAVRARLGYDPFFHAARQTIVVEINDDADTLRGRMRLLDENGIIIGSRELEEKVGHCEELVASLALAISIALDPSAALGAAPDDSRPERSETAPAMVAEDAELEPIPAATTANEPEPSARPAPVAARGTIEVSVRASAFASAWAAPATSFGARLGMGVGLQRFRLVAEFADQFPASASLADGGTVRSSTLDVTLAPCLVAAPLSGCALLDVGSLRTEGRNIDNPAAQSTLQLALGGRIEVAPKLVGRLHLLLNLDVLRSLTPVDLRVRGERVWSTPWLSAKLGAGLELGFP